jgi:hypothetical protein
MSNDYRKSGRFEASVKKKKKKKGGGGRKKGDKSNKTRVKFV